MAKSEKNDGFVSRFFLKYNETLRQFFTYEYYFLTGNPSFNPEKFIRESKLKLREMDNYFTFPMIFTQSVFRGLDANHQNYLTIDDYVDGFMTIYSGKLSERINFMFEMFNINNDEYVHKNDVILILNYVHYFDNKKKNDLLISIIDDFFAGRTVLTVDKFVNRMYNKSSGLFFVIMCIFFEHENFNSNVINVIEEEKINNIKSVCDFKKCSQKSSSISLYSTKLSKVAHIENLSDLKTPSEAVLEYILINYDIDLSFLIETETEKDLDKSINSNDSNELNGLEEEELMVLNSFENDIIEIKQMLINKTLFSTNEFQFPEGGSSGFELKSEIVSPFCSSIRKSKLNSHRSHAFFGTNKELPFINSERNNDEMEKKQSFGGDVIARGCKSQGGNQGVNQGDDRITFRSTVVEAASLNDTRGGDLFTEEVIVVKANKGYNQKSYILTLINGYLLVFKKRSGNTLTIEKATITTNLKQFIPLRHLYVSGMESNIPLGDEIYYKLCLVSTAKWYPEYYYFFFDTKSRLKKLVKLIYEQTNYTSIKSEYTYVKDIGKGAFCQAKLMRHTKENKLYAVKILKKTFKSIGEFTSLNWEKDIVNFLKNVPDLENIMRYHEVKESIEHIYIVMEYFPTGSLINFLRKSPKGLSSTVVKGIVTQIVKGVKQLHSFGIMHRDLKLENLVIDTKDNKYKVKIIDFGLSQVLTPHTKTKENFGTLVYCPPEILLGLPYNHKIDVWSIGIIAFYLEYGMLPFQINGKEGKREISNMIIMNELNFPEKKFKKKMVEELKANFLLTNLIKFGLCKDINQRPSIQGLLDTLTMEDQSEVKKM